MAQFVVRLTCPDSSRGSSRSRVRRRFWIWERRPWLIANIGGAPIGVADMDARYAVYPALPPGNKYELVLDGAEHSVFTDRPLPGETGQRRRGCTMR